MKILTDEKEREKKKHIKSRISSFSNCLDQVLHTNIKINGKVVLNEKWQEKGIFFINDMKTNGNGLMSVEELGLKYQITNACMFYNSLLSCLPRFWKCLIQNSARLLSVTGSNMEQFDKIRNCIL